jgi:RimJ/RimL family protein N-acetyltransferase
MIRVSSSQVTQQIRQLFDPDAPASLRCFAVLEGRSAGQVWVDTLTLPNSGIVREAAFGSLYFGGESDAGIISDLISIFKKEGDVLVGLWPNDDVWQKLPPDPDYVGAVLEFNRRIGDKPLQPSREHIPGGCQLRPLDSDLFKHSMMAKYLTNVYGNVEKALEQGIGLCLMRGEEILSEGFAGPSANGLTEIGVETRQQHGNRGYATCVCARLIKECEQLGLSTYWNCDARNTASIALARKLGYHTGKSYDLVAWLKR